jgi:hypothetical protein
MDVRLVAVVAHGLGEVQVRGQGVAAQGLADHPQEGAFAVAARAPEEEQDLLAAVSRGRVARDALQVGHHLLIAAHHLVQKGQPLRARGLGVVDYGRPVYVEVLVIGRQELARTQVH